VRGWWWYLPLGVTVWALMYNGGIHATVAGVPVGLILRTTRDEGEQASPGERTGHLLHPLSAGICVPLFALFAAGVSVSGDALGKVLTTPEPLGVVIGLLAGKILGIFAGTYLAARFTRAQLTPSWPGLMSSVSPRRPASGSPSRCSSANSPSPAPPPASRQGRRPHRLPGRGPAGRPAPAPPEHRLPAPVRGGEHRRGRRRHPRHLPAHPGQRRMTPPRAHRPLATAAAWLLICVLATVALILTTPAWGKTLWLIAAAAALSTAVQYARRAR
jgi:hypothetical protein